jgi:hypothetical protein
VKCLEIDLEGGNMNLSKRPADNEDGYILVLALVILLMVTLFGVSSLSVSVTDLQIAGNQRVIAQNFSLVDSVWRLGGLWLNEQEVPPEIVNRTVRSGDREIDLARRYYAVVRNYGNGGDGVVNDTFPAEGADGSFLGIPFFYRVSGVGEGPAGLSGQGFREFAYEIESSAAGRTAVAVTMYKVFPVGY